MTGPETLEVDNGARRVPAGPSPRVSIVMPTFNSSRHLVSTVESVLAQTFPDWELVLIDDGSTDDTVRLSREVAERDHRIRVATSAHGGVAAARNRGLARTDRGSEFVVFLDSDDTWEPDALATLVTALEDHPECVAAHALARATDLDGRQFEADDLADSMRKRCVLHGRTLVDLPLSAPTPFAAMLLKNCVVTPGASLIRRSVLESVGPLVPATSPADDWDLAVRLARRGDFHFIDRVVLNWRRHPGSLANTSRRWRWGTLVARRRSVQSEENTPAQRRLAMAVLLEEARTRRSQFAADLSSRRLREACIGLPYTLLTYFDYCRFRLFPR